MFALATLTGICSYLIFSLGVLGLLNKNIIGLLSVFFISGFIIYFFKTIRLTKINLASVLKEKFVFLLLALLIVQVVINFIGVLGQELSFDALWYHLTLPKLYIQNHAVVHVPGSLLYYSDMPKLIEMLYVPALLFGNEIFAKLIHFSFGLLSCSALYFLCRKLFDRKLSIIAVIIFYSNLVVGWQSITAYVDLARTFFEIIALWGFINFLEGENKKWLIVSAVMIGLATSVKILALGSLFIFLTLIIYFGILNHHKPRKIVNQISIFLLFSLLIPFPWFIFSFLNTGNPFYPLFTNIYPVSFSLNLLNPFNFLTELWSLLIRSADPVSPLYLIFLPLIAVYFIKFSKTSKFIGLYSMLAVLVWYFTPRTGGGRFILPYLPAFSILVVQVIAIFEKKVEFRRLFLVLVVGISLSSIIYREVANAKFIPVILGRESKNQFLSNHLNFSFGDFYDTDGYFKKNITSKDTVLLYGFHNLYYVDFPFVDSSWVKKGNKFNYIATQNSDLPKRFSNWDLVYYNSKTHVNLYSLGGIKWVY